MLRKSLQLCAEIENTIGNIYENFAESPDISVEMKTLWKQMALDEMDHERQIRFALQLPADQVTLDHEEREDQRIATMHRQVREAYAHVQRVPLKAEKMLEMAKQLEGRFLEAHAAIAASCQNDQIRKMLAALGKSDQEHIAQLTRFIEESEKKSS